MSLTTFPASSMETAPSAEPHDRHNGDSHITISIINFLASWQFQTGAKILFSLGQGLGNIFHQGPGS